MRFEIYRDNGGQFHWCLAGEDGTRLALSATAFGSPQDARDAAADVRLHGSASGAEES
jgi:uncharacterized protein YegP (UPF0339 family)